jgi:hypothetical protein
MRLPALLGPSVGRIACIALATAGTSSAADYSFFFTISNDVTPEQPQATVTLWATFPEYQHAFGQSHTEVLSAPDAGGFSNPKALIEQYYYCDPGDVSPDGDSILKILLFQLDYLGGKFADESNPIALWSVTWSTDDLTPRTVPIATQTADFYVYYGPGGGWYNYYDANFSEAQGIITVLREVCFPDFTGDGLLDLFDFLAYVNTFNAGNPDADCTKDGPLDLFDFLCFVNAFNEGC